MNKLETIKKANTRFSNYDEEEQHTDKMDFRVFQDSKIFEAHNKSFIETNWTLLAEHYTDYVRVFEERKKQKWKKILLTSIAFFFNLSIICILGMIFEMKGGFGATLGLVPFTLLALKELKKYMESYKSHIQSVME